MTSPADLCSHGKKLLLEDCLRCQKIWLESRIADFAKWAEMEKREIALIDALLASEAADDGSEKISGANVERNPEIHVAAGPPLSQPSASHPLTLEKKL